MVIKTDWNGRRDFNGRYIGDRFDATSYNRIKNNLIELRNEAIRFVPEFDIIDAGADKTYSDYIYADEMNVLWQNLVIISQHTVGTVFDAPVYRDNGRTMTFVELNTLERGIQDIYNQLPYMAEGKRMLTFRLGIEGGILQ